MDQWWLTADEITGLAKTINQMPKEGKASATSVGRQRQLAKAQESRVAQLNQFVRHVVHEKLRHWPRRRAAAGSIPGKERAGPALV
jgi:hypothetical protein